MPLKGNHGLLPLGKALPKPTGGPCPVSLPQSHLYSPKGWSVDAAPAPRSPPQSSTLSTETALSWPAIAVSLIQRSHARPPSPDLIPSIHSSTTILSKQLERPCQQACGTAMPTHTAHRHHQCDAPHAPSCLPITPSLKTQTRPLLSTHGLTLI